MKRGYLFLGITFLSFVIGIGAGEALTINFEGLDDSTRITNQYAGVTFSNATILTAGFSLNEFEFPPRSGSNVVFDDGGPMTLTFSTPMAEFEASFTYLTPLTLSFYDSSNTLIGTETSLFSSNLALSGDPGSSPNELIDFSWGSGISRVDILGDPFGGSYTMDDLNTTPVPEPGTLMLLGSGILGLMRYRMKRNCKLS